MPVKPIDPAEDPSSGPEVVFGFYLKRSKPTSGIPIPGTFKLNLPLVNFKGWVQIQIEGFSLYAAAEV